VSAQARGSGNDLLAGRVEELLDEESLAVVAILLAVALEFGFGFAKTVSWWAGLTAGPAALVTLTFALRLRRAHRAVVRFARWILGRS
jgi:hypothetical protein